MKIFFVLGNGVVRQCTWNLPNWENKERNCPKDVEYCAIDRKGETGNNRQRDEQDDYRCARWKSICFCQDDLCNQGSKLHENYFLKYCLMSILITGKNIYK